MKIIDQGTDITTTGSYSSTQNIVDETSGSQFDINFSPSIPNVELLQSALDTVNQLTNLTIRTYAIRLIGTFRNVTVAFQKNGFDVSRLPSLRATNLDDNTLFVEWIFPDFRIGFTIGSDPNNNSWFLVTNRKLEEYSSSGNLSNSNLENTVLRLFSFVFANS